jgi:hypothetical protein
MRRWVCACGLGAFACSNTGSGGLGDTSGGATAGDVGDLCATRCARNERCGSPDPTCQDNCGNDLQHPENYRADVIDAFTACLASLACDMNDDSCLEQALNTVTPNWQQDALLNECSTRHDACQSSFSDDFCAAAVYFTETGRQRLRECINLDCAAISACLQGLG